MNTKLVTIGVVAALAVLMIGALAVSSYQNAFAREFRDQNQINVQSHNHAKNILQASQENINGDNKVEGGIHLR
ncbi:MAG TPA: hypothetical protein VH796_18850 [Nitrososphaeraceae archaeon]|jgi:cell division protein FtsN